MLAQASLPIRCFLDDLDLLFRQPVQLVDQPVYLPVRRLDLVPDHRPLPLDPRLLQPLLQLPGYHLQSLHLVEMSISGDQSQLILLGYGGDTDIVFRDRSSCFAQPALDPAVTPCGNGIANEHGIVGRELGCAFQILFDTRRSVSPKEKLAHTSNRNQRVLVTHNKDRCHHR